MDTAHHYGTLYENSAREYAFAAQTAAELKQWQREFRERLGEVLGLHTLTRELADFAPRAELLQREELDGYTRESWQLWTEPTLALPFYLLVPDGGEGPRPLVLTPHGHNPPHLYVGLFENEAEREHISAGDRDIAVQAVRRGYIAIAPTARGFGATRSEADIAEDKLCSCRMRLMHGLLVGRTPIGERVWDISRLVDWALDHLEVDPGRIAITGNSGGGTITLFAAACDTRLALAMPGSYFCTFTGSIGSIFHCDCNYVPGILQLAEMWDVAGLIAPRPFCAVHGRDDPIFPVQETRLAYGKLQRVYEVAGAPESCRLYVGEGGHRFYADGAWPFVSEHFGC